jgi:hypothetical protein
VWVADNPDMAKRGWHMCDACLMTAARCCTVTVLQAKPPMHDTSLKLYPLCPEGDKAAAAILAEIEAGEVEQEMRPVGAAEDCATQLCLLQERNTQQLCDAETVEAVLVTIVDMAPHTPPQILSTSEAAGAMKAGAF